jgi:hypothetical protein
MKHLLLGLILTAITALLSTSVSAESNEVFFEDCGYRCEPYETCQLGNDKMACHYGSGGCCSGGVTFKNGKNFSIEWITDYFDNEGRPVSEPKEGYFALVNDKRARFKIHNEGSKEGGCISFYKPNMGSFIFAYGDC